MDTTKGKEVQVMYNDYNNINNNDFYNNYSGSYTDYTYAGNQQPQGKKNRNRKKTIKKIVAVVLCCSVIGGGIYAYSGSVNSASSSSGTTQIVKSSRTTSDVSFTSVSSGEEMTAKEVYAANVGSTVGITTSINTNYFGYRTTSAASGSGFIISADGYIVTNYHVIEDASEIKVSTYDDKSYDAELVGYDESNDVAVLKIDAGGLTPVTIGDSDSAAVGDDVVAIGNPLGELTFTLTKGVISALDREVTLSTGVTMDLIQTDCAINSGNSGGALFNMYGELIGITNAKYSTSASSSEASIDNIGFAIPINSVIDIIQNIIETGSTTNVTEQTTEQSGSVPGFGYGSMDNNGPFYQG